MRRIVLFTLAATLVMAALFSAGCGKNPVGPTAAVQDFPTMDWYAARQNEIGSVSMDEMVSIIDEAYAANPDSAIGPVREYIWNALKAKKDQPESRAEPTEIESYSIFELTWQETLLLLGEPWYCSPTNTCKNLAVNEANIKWPGSQFQTKADAFRHAYWNVLMCRRINEDWARKYSTAHESDLKNGLLDAQMDLNNNGIGRALWRSAGWSKSEAQYSSLIKGWQYVKVSSFDGAKTYLIYLQ